MTLAGSINRQQQDVIAYIQEDNRILKNKLKGKRIRFTDDERRRLAVKGKVLGRKALRQVAVTRYYVLFFIKLSNRRVHVAGITPQPHASWIKQIARNVTDPIDGFLLSTRYLIMDRDAIFTAAFHNFLKQEGVKAVRLPPRSPNLTPHIERFMRSIKEECLGRMIFFGESSLRTAINEFLTHYHHERNHQGLGNRLI